MHLVIYSLIVLFLFINASNCSLLLIVGDVTQTKARILYRIALLLCRYELLFEEKSDALKVEIYKHLDGKLKLVYILYMFIVYVD